MSYHISTHIKCCICIALVSQLYGKKVNAEILYRAYVFFKEDCLALLFGSFKWE